jgi:chromosome segregation ATPase
VTTVSNDGEGSSRTAPAERSTAERLDTLESRVSELEATTRALRGYVGGVRAADTEIERRADAALAAVSRLDAELETIRAEREDTEASTAPSPDEEDPASSFDEEDPASSPDDPIERLRKRL